MQRRTFVTLAAAAPLLVACKTSTGAAPTPTSVSQNIVLLAGAVAAALPQLQSVPGITTAVISQVQMAANDLAAVQVAFANAETVDAALPLVRRAVADGMAVSTALQGTVLPGKLQQAVLAIPVVLGLIETAMGLMGTVPGAHQMSPVAALKALRDVQATVSVPITK